jgi:hypothetical protein
LLEVPLIVPDTPEAPALVEVPVTPLWALELPSTPSVVPLPDALPITHAVPELHLNVFAERRLKHHWVLSVFRSSVRSGGAGAIRAG